jgi:hypothetical protein
MRWLRSWVKESSCVALFAMALQLALSFGHVHLEHVLASPEHAAAYPTNPSAATLIPSDELPAGTSDECALCALIALANSLILPISVALPVPAHFEAAQHASARDLSVAQTTLRPFQARAPPLV